MYITNLMLALEVKKLATSFLQSTAPHILTNLFLWPTTSEVLVLGSANFI